MPPNYSNHYLSSLNIDLISDDANVSITDTDKIFHLNEVLHPPPFSHFLIGVNAFCIPYTWYGISATKGNNTFKLSTYNGVDTNTLTITVPDGNYTATTLKDVINKVGTTPTAGQTSKQIRPKTKVNIESFTNPNLLAYLLTY